MTEPAKFDSDKNPLGLLPFAAIAEVGKVLAFGAKRYGENNWRDNGGLAWSRLVGAALRHTFAWVQGEDNDADSGLNHLAHAATNLLFLLSYVLDGNGKDDRWRGPVRGE